AGARHPAGASARWPRRTRNSSTGRPRSPTSTAMSSTARNPTQALIAAIEGNVGGIAVIRYPDLGLRDWTIREVEGLARPDAQPLRTPSVDEAIQNPHRLVLLVPQDERAVVEDLDGNRDRLLDPPRTQPVILFLLRDGDGSDALAKAPSLT